MGSVILFPRHAQCASAAGLHSAKASKVICEQPREPASRTSSGHRRGGIPRVRQMLTVEASSPKSAASAPVPPKASIASSEVKVMTRNIVCTAQTSQEFADCKTTSWSLCAPIGRMIDPPKAIGRRLAALRVALGFKTQVAFAEKLNIDKSTYNPFENGIRPLTFEVACTIRKLYGVPLDWLFYGADADRIPAHIHRKLGNVA